MALKQIQQQMSDQINEIFSWKKVDNANTEIVRRSITIKSTPPSTSAAATTSSTVDSEFAMNFGIVGISCVAAQASVHWTTPVMIRQQLSSSNVSFPGAFQSVYSEGGIKGLYRGFSGAILREAAYTSRFGLYEPIKGMLTKDPQESSAAVNFLAGFTAGALSAAVASPTDLFAIRMVSNQGPAMTLRETIQTSLNQSGFKGLYTGVGASMSRYAFMGGTKMGVYDTVKHTLRHNGFEDGPLMITLASTICGFAVTAASCPATNAQTVIMASKPGTHNGMLSAFRQIVREQGPQGMFRGFGALFIRATPYTLVQFAVWEQLRHMCGLSYLS